MTGSDRVLGIADVVSQLRPGMTIGIGGWGSRRKPMALVRAIARSGVTDLTIASFGGPDVGLLIAAGAVRRVIAGFVSLDSIPLEPHFRRARQSGSIELTELDEGMMHWGLLAAAQRLPFLPIRAGLGSDVLRTNPQLRTIRSPYEDAQELVAMPALRLDLALVHLNRADASGNGQCLGPDPYFDDLFCLAAERAFVSCERIVPTAQLTEAGPPLSLLVNRAMVHGVVQTPGGAHFTSCVPDYGRDEAFQAEYATAAASAESWERFSADYLDGNEASYQEAVRRFREGRPGRPGRTDASEMTGHDGGIGPATGSAIPADPGRHAGTSPEASPVTTAGSGRVAGTGQAARAATVAEICIAACARAWQGDGAILASPMGLIPSLAARLARLTFAPDLLITDGEAMLVVPGDAGDIVEGWMPYRDVLRLVATGRRHMMMGAAQLDRFGNQNISCIGGWARPKAQLLGVRGAPGNTINHPVSYWIPRHSARVLVEHVDMVCGIGYDRAAELAGGAPERSADGGAGQADYDGARFHEIRLVVTDKAVLDFRTADHSMRVRSVHPGVGVDQVRALTGFPLVVSDNLTVTPLPTPAELELIRELLDPAGLRDRELA